MLALLGVRVKCAYSSECQLCTNASYVHTATCICTYTCVTLYLISASAVYICHWIYKTIHNVDRGFLSRGWRRHEFPIYPQSKFTPLESNNCFPPSPRIWVHVLATPISKIVDSPKLYEILQSRLLVLSSTESDAQE